ncbi:hypothetical protein [Geothrix terrae]|uniref:hypothetical protein n=1 Tax=Geothrix terrae TaxID=2922720 RepID=UPI001FAE3DC8|nr:hypothetical protein [Geothrix terrae]
MIAKPQALREALERFLRSVLPDERIAPSVAAAELQHLAREFGGQTIPRIQVLDALEDEAQADRLLPLGAKVAVERLGVHRSTIYRRAHRHRTRKAA